MMPTYRNSVVIFYVQIQNSGTIPQFYVLKKIAQAQCLGSILRLNVQAQYSDSISKPFVPKK